VGHPIRTRQRGAVHKGQQDTRHCTGEYARVESVDEKQNHVTVERENGQRQSYDPRRLQGVTLYERQSERSVKATHPVHRPNREQYVANRELGTIEKLDDSGNLRIRLDSGRSIAFNIRENPHLDCGYAVTSHSSQGQTADRVLIHVDTEQGERNSSIVASHTSRCRAPVTTRKSTPTIRPPLPKVLTAMFRTDPHWKRHAQQNHRSHKGPSRPRLWRRRENEQSNETSALAARHTIL